MYTKSNVKYTIPVYLVHEPDVYYLLLLIIEIINNNYVFLNKRQGYRNFQNTVPGIVNVNRKISK